MFRNQSKTKQVIINEFDKIYFLWKQNINKKYYKDKNDVIIIILI